MCDYTPDELQEMGPCLDPLNRCESCEATCGRESNFCPGCGKQNPHFEETVFSKESGKSLAEALEECRKGHSPAVIALTKKFDHLPHCPICGKNLLIEEPQTETPKPQA